VNPLGYYDVHGHQYGDVCALPAFEAPAAGAAATETVNVSSAGGVNTFYPVYNSSQVFNLHSKADSHFTIYIDFNGQTVSGTSWNSYNGGKDIVAPAFSLDSDRTTFSDAERRRIYGIWQRVAEDYAPFDVDVTTEEPSLDRLKKSGSGDTDWGIRVIVDDNSNDWYGNAGGVAYTGSFTSNTDLPVWVFSNQLGSGNEKYMAAAITHEAGHALGLSHDGIKTTNSNGTTTTKEYYDGANGWGTQMGTGYYQALTQWSKGEYAGATQTQDDLAIITKAANGITYRADDHGNSIATATVLDTSGTTLQSWGIIERNTDADYFRFTLDVAQQFNLTIKSGDIEPDLDILAKLYNGSGSVIATSDSVGTLNATFSQALEAGTYYISVDGTGKIVNGGVIYTDYASLGTYSFSTTLTKPVPQPPTAPANLKAADITASSVKLTWTAQSNLAGYTLTYADKTVQLAADAVSYTVPDLTDNTAYTFTLTAKNGSGTAAAAVSATIPAAVEPLDTPVVTATGKFINSRNGNAVLEWNAVAGSASYVIYRKDFLGNWTQIATTTNLKYTDLYAPVGDQTYAVKAVRGTREFVLGTVSVDVPVTDPAWSLFTWNPGQWYTDFVTWS
jgi:hypothetical protein